MKILVSMLFGCLLNFAVLAQPSHLQTPERKAASFVNGGLKYTLKLTDQQISKIVNIYTEYYKATDSLRKITLHGKDVADVQSKRMTMFEKVQHETDERVKPILDADQRAAFAKMLSSRGFVTIASPASGNK